MGIFYKRMASRDRSMFPDALFSSVLHQWVGVFDVLIDTVHAVYPEGSRHRLGYALTLMDICGRQKQAFIRQQYGALAHHPTPRDLSIETLLSTIASRESDLLAAVTPATRRLAWVVSGVRSQPGYVMGAHLIEVLENASRTPQFREQFGGHDLALTPMSLEIAKALSGLYSLGVSLASEYAILRFVGVSPTGLRVITAPLTDLDRQLRIGAQVGLTPAQVMDWDEGARFGIETATYVVLTMMISGFSVPNARHAGALYSAGRFCQSQMVHVVTHFSGPPDTEEREPTHGSFRSLALFMAQTFGFFIPHTLLLLLTMIDWLTRSDPGGEL